MTSPKKTRKNESLSTASFPFLPSLGQDQRMSSFIPTRHNTLQFQFRIILTLHSRRSRTRQKKMLKREKYSKKNLSTLRNGMITLVFRSLWVGNTSQRAKKEIIRKFYLERKRG